MWYSGYSQNVRKKIAEFYGLEDTILYAAAFDANGGVLNLCWENKIVSFRIV
jgi:glycine C-acetyltransferase